MSLLSSIPSPSRGVLYLGPIPLRAYAICILLGVLAAIWLARKRWAALGFDPKQISDIAVWAVPAGLIGARLYHVITDYQMYTDDPVRAFKIWDGGLGIWGGVALGAAVGLVVARRWGMSLPLLLDAVAPAIPLAQAIGRFGNYFNQELFGRPTTLPWGLEIDFAHRPAGFTDATTFHPTFLYESLWCLAVVAVVLLVERAGWLAPGRLFALYAAAYSFGRFWFEALRIDPAHEILGLRLNDWVSIVVFATASLVVLTGWRRADPTDDVEPDSPREELEAALEEPLE
ncbi:MAG TPA: prolipoprotein diacylglyceryl transferase [Acidimicrobiales bacterium]